MAPEAGFTAFSKSFKDDNNLSEEELQNACKTEWSNQTEEQRKKYADEEQTMSRRELFKSHSEMLTYRGRLLRWLVDLIRSPLPSEAIHWYLYSCCLLACRM